MDSESLFGKVSAAICDILAQHCSRCIEFEKEISIFGMISVTVDKSNNREPREYLLKVSRTLEKKEKTSSESEQAQSQSHSSTPKPSHGQNGCVIGPVGGPETCQDAFKSVPPINLFPRLSCDAMPQFPFAALDSKGAAMLGAQLTPSDASLASASRLMALEMLAAFEARRAHGERLGTPLWAACDGRPGLALGADSSHLRPVALQLPDLACFVDEHAMDKSGSTGAQMKVITDLKQDRRALRHDPQTAEVFSWIRTMADTSDTACQICGKQFTNKWSLRRHLLQHTGYKPYLCVLCNRSFYRRDHFSSHMIAWHKNDPNRCAATNSALGQAESALCGGDSHAFAIENLVAGAFQDKCDKADSPLSVTRTDSSHDTDRDCRLQETEGRAAKRIMLDAGVENVNERLSEARSVHDSPANEQRNDC